MVTKRLELGRDVWLNTVHTDRFKTGCFSINLLQPLAKETASLYALIPSVLLRGCTSFPDMQKISHRLDELYGASIGTLIRKKGEVQTIGLYADFLDDRYANHEPVFADVMQLLRDLLCSPCTENGGFLPAYVRSEKNNLANTIDSTINDKRSYASTRLLKHMCASEAYCVTRLGEKEVLERTDEKSLYAMWQTLLRTSRMELFYLGPQPEEEIIHQVERLISCLPPREDTVPVHTQVHLSSGDIREVSEELDVTQGKLSIGFRTPITVLDSRYPALMLLNAVYGSGMTSKLFMKIREEQSLCYYASSSLDRLKGVMIVNSGIEFDKYEVAKEGILHQLELCQKGEITDDELESARQYLISALRAFHDNPGQLDDFMISQAIAGVEESVMDLIEALLHVTMEQVIEAACTLTPDTIYFLKGVQCV